MKYKHFHHPEQIAYCPVGDNDECEPRLMEEINGIRITKQTDNDDQLLIDIFAWCNENGIFAISNLIYFDNQEEKIDFFLRWGGLIA